MLMVWIIGRNGSVKDMFPTNEYEINIDYITSDKSTFYTGGRIINYSKGDYILVKRENIKDIIYFGIVDSYVNSDILCNDIITLLNYEFAATKTSGKSFEEHMRTLINNTLVKDPNKEISNLVITSRTKTAHMYQPSDPPTPTNLMKYMINGFKKYNVVWRFDKFEDGKIYTVIEKVTSSIQIKDNSRDFFDWDVSSTEVGRGIDNHLIIVDKRMKDSENPKILSQWWSTNENEVINDGNDKRILKPTKTMVYVYDTEDESKDKPTQQEVAESELHGSYYSHEISVSMTLENKLIDFNNIQVGELTDVYYKDRLYKSVFTGYEISNNNNVVLMKFGHIRSKFSELLE